MVQRAQTEFAFTKVVQAQGVAHLQVKVEVVVGLFIAPSKTRFEHFQADQPVDRYVRSGGYISVQNGEGLFVYATKEITVEDGCPGILQKLTTLFE